MLQGTSQTQSIEEFRAGIPALRNKAYMNFGAQGVLARETMDSITRSYEYVQENGPLCAKMFGWLTEEMASTRRAFAGEFHCGADAIALTQSTTDGCNIGLWGLPWKAGETLVITDAEHSGVVASAAQIARRLRLNLSICPVASQTDEQILSWLEQNLSAKTRLFLFSHILWTNGKSLPVKEIVELCHSKGVLALVDGAQSAGVLDLDIPATGADFYAITGHKWMGGPEGMGALYVAPEVLEELEPTFVGWRSCKFDALGSPSGWEAGATRYEVATAPVPLMAAMRTAISLRARHGSAAERYQNVIDNARKLRLALSQIEKVRILTGENPTSGLVSFAVQGMPSNKLCAQLEAQQIIVRTISSPDCIRASLHYFSSDGDIAKLAGAVEAACKS